MAPSRFGTSLKQISEHDVMYYLLLCAKLECVLFFFLLLKRVGGLGAGLRICSTEQ